MDHELMTISYVKPMIEYLSAVFNISNTDAGTIVWKGLISTASWKNSTEFDTGDFTGTGASIKMSKQDMQNIGVNYSLGIQGKNLCDQ
jgi:hypothetical protein